MAYDILQSSTQSALLFFLVQTSDHITALTGASPTVTISKNGAAFASPSGAVTEIANGWYKVAGNATDTGTLGPLALHATATSGDPCDILVANIVSYNPQSATNLGLSALPTATAGASNGLLISGTNSGTTTFGAVTCTGTFTVSDGFLISRSTANSVGMSITGSGSGNGLTIAGGAGATTTAGGIGISIAGGAGGTTGASASGLKIVGGVAGSTSGNASPAVLLTGGAAAAGTGSGAEAVNATGGAASTTAVGGNAYTLTGGAAATAKAGGIGISVAGGAASTTGAGGTGISITGADGGTTSAGQHGITIVSGKSGTTSAAAGNGINITAGIATAGSGAAGIGLNILGGTATSTGTAGVGINITGGSGAASTNGAASGVTITGGGTNTVSNTADGLTITGTSNGNGLTLTHAGTGKDFNATTTPLTLAKTTNITGLNDIAATAIVSSGAITTSGGAVSTVTTVTNQLTAAAIATGIWQDTTAGDFTTSASIGKSIMNGVALGTGLTINAYTGNTPQTGDVYARIGTAGVGLTNLGDTRIANLDTTVSSRMATYTQPTGFLAATFPTGTIANTTNITAGTITTATNLTNAPTAGDFTSTMKTSLNNSTPASITGAVGSVTSGVTVSTNNDKTGYSLTQAFPSNFSSLSITAAGLVAITSNRKKASAATFEIQLADSSTGAPKTGLTVTSVISKDGGSAVSTSNSVTEIGLGQYQIVLTATEMTANNIFLQFTATGAITYSLAIQTQP